MITLGSIHSAFSLEIKQRKESGPINEHVNFTVTRRNPYNSFISKAKKF
jgi:hypothetical protein